MTDDTRQSREWPLDTPAKDSDYRITVWVNHDHSRMIRTRTWRSAAIRGTSILTRLVMRHKFIFNCLNWFHCVNKRFFQPNSAVMLKLDECYTTIRWWTWSDPRIACVQLSCPKKNISLTFDTYMTKRFDSILAQNTQVKWQERNTENEKGNNWDHFSVCLSLLCCYKSLWLQMIING